MNENRFIVIREEGTSILSSGLRQIIVDRETGVNYLWVRSGNAGGLTPLLDRDGKPVVTPASELRDVK